MHKTEIEALINMSVRLGADLTPDMNLESRLQTAKTATDGCISELDKLVKKVLDYAVTVKDIDIQTIKNNILD